MLDRRHGGDGGSSTAEKGSWWDFTGWDGGKGAIFHGGEAEGTVSFRNYFPTKDKNILIGTGN